MKKILFYKLFYNVDIKYKKCENRNKNIKYYIFPIRSNKCFIHSHVLKKSYVNAISFELKLYR